MYSLDKALTASQLIEILKTKIKTHGDLPVTIAQKGGAEPLVQDVKHTAAGQSSGAHYGTGDHEFFPERLAITVGSVSTEDFRS